MAPQPKLLYSYQAKWLVGCFFLTTICCGATGCLLTLWLYGVEDRPRPVGTLPWADVANALFFIVPMVTAVIVVALFLTSIGLWFFQTKTKDEGE